MANEENKVMSTDSTIRELQEIVDVLPRIDDETLARMQAIADINDAKSDKEKVGDKTVGQVKNEFMYGVSDLDQEAGKHELVVKEGREGTRSVTVIPPVIKATDEDGKEHEVQSEKLVITPTPANVAAVDADAPHNPVEAKEAADEASKPTDTPVEKPVIPASPATPNATPSSSAQAPIVNPNLENK